MDLHPGLPLPLSSGAFQQRLHVATSRCEFAIAAVDSWQGSGLAGSLMAALMDSARKKGLTEMEGFVLAANHKMLKFARQLGFVQHRDADDRETVHGVRTL